MRYLDRITDGRKMEFHEFVERYQITKAAKVLLLLWLANAAYAGVLFVLGHDPLFLSLTLKLASVSILFLSLIVSVLLASIATYGAIRYESSDRRMSTLFKLWIVPFIGGVYFLALRMPEQRRKQSTVK